ncbi:MAG: glycoside hydrolase family 2 TIM barrel-domain containing protein [Opitutaceae bacterium]|nr:glycoside hydrolase family 2 TIM barrel-domain containing protein [Opitutaceae bacterium]
MLQVTPVVEKAAAAFLRLVALCTLPLASRAIEIPLDESVPLNSGWQFHRGEAERAEEPAHDVKSWRTLDLPHDWSIELPGVLKAGEGLRDPNLPRGADIGYLRGGVGWYRKELRVEGVMPGERVEVTFDGVQQDAEVWVNGRFAAFQPNGYIPFTVDLTPYLGPGGAAVLAVRAQNPLENSRWYAGSGLYREVSIRRTGPVYLPHDGVRIDTFRLVDGLAVMQVRPEIVSTLERPTEVSVALAVKDEQGAETVFPMGVLTVTPSMTNQPSYNFSLESPRLWSPESPHRYTLELRLEAKGQRVASWRGTFGVRSVEVSADKGFLLNGKSVKLRGGCVHHDNGLLGAASFRDAEFRRVRLLKEAGFNAIRTSHNPPSAALLEACDALGLLVIDEFCDTWEMAKRPNGYQRHFASHWERDLRAFVRRDYNRPCVVMWSIGNEITERARPQGVEWSRRLAECIKGMDTKRPVTNGICGLWDNPEMGDRWFANAPAYRHLDVLGNNYYSEAYEKDHELHPHLPVVGTESYPAQAWINTRLMEKHPYVIGDFVWTAMDHIGESGIGHATFESDPESKKDSVWQLLPWPVWINGSGDIDLIGDRKAQSFYRDVAWDLRTVAALVQDAVPEGKTELIGAWGWTQEQPVWPATSATATRRVNVYTKGDRAVVRLNGREVASQAVNPDTLTASIQVPFEAGRLEAEAFRGATSLGVVALETTGSAARLVAAPEQGPDKSGQDRLIYIPISVVDAAGRLQTDGERELRVKLSGPAVLQAFGSANPVYLGELQSETTKTYRGRALLILRASGKGGEVTVSVSSDGVETAHAKVAL